MSVPAKQRPDLQILTCHDEHLLHTAFDIDGFLVGYGNIAPELLIQMIEAGKAPGWGFPYCAEWPDDSICANVTSYYGYDIDKAANIAFLVLFSLSTLGFVGSIALVTNQPQGPVLFTDLLLLERKSFTPANAFPPNSTAETLIKAMHKRGIDSLNNLTVVSNNAGTAIGGGLSPLVESGQVSKAICSFLGGNKSLESKYLKGEVAIELTPQGTLAEKLRAGGAGSPAFFVSEQVVKGRVCFLRCVVLIGDFV